MDPVLRLIAATPDVRKVLVEALAEHGVAHRDEGKMVVVESAARMGPEEAEAPARVVALLRDALSGPEREAVSIVEDLAFPHEFPVTTRLEAWWSVFETSWFGKAAAEDDFSIWFQPMVDTIARRLIGHECLLRLSKGHRREGAEIMAAAAAHRDLRAFDAYARRLAIRAVSTQISMAAPARSTPKADSLYFLNFIPSTITQPATSFHDTLEELKDAGVPPGNLVLEAVDSRRDTDIGHLRRIGDYLREQGIGLALDDILANAEALRLVCEIQPAYIKLERHLVNRMEQPQDAAAVSRLVDVAERFSVRVLAKGVERISTMEQLQAVGVRCMQGHLFGSPSPEVAATTVGVTHITRAIPPSAHSEWRESLVSVGLS